MKFSINIIRFKLLNTLFVVCILFLISSSCAHQSNPKDEEPLWEANIYNAAARIPHYPGSDEYNHFVFPIPFIVYRGDILKADRKGIRGIFYKSEHFESKISLYGNPPVDEDNKAREGMPELDTMIEAGPAFDWFFNERNSLNTLYIKLAARGAYSLDFDGGMNTRYEGLHGNLNLIYWNTGFFQKQRVRFGFSGGIIFADKDFNSYFYDVPEKYVLPERNYYKSDSGYSGFTLISKMGKTITNRISIGSYLRWDNFDKAAFEDSPLVKNKNNFLIGVVLVWKFAESKIIVKKDRMYDE